MIFCVGAGLGVVIFCVCVVGAGVVGVCVVGVCVVGACVVCVGLGPGL